MKLKHLIIVLTLVGFGLRVYGLHVQPLWGDEGWSFYFSTMPLVEMPAKTARNIHPPFYYALLHIWLDVAGIGAEIARFLSILCGTLLIPVGYLFGKELVSQGDLRKVLAQAKKEQLGLAAAALITVAPMAVYYSQEVRMYELATLLGLLSTFFMGQLLKGQKRALWRYVLAAGLALYTHYYSAFILLAHGLYWLTRYRRFTPEVRITIFKGLAIAGGLYLPWIIFAARTLRNYVAGKSAAESYAPLALGSFVNSYLTAFSLGHASEVLQTYRWMAFGFMALALAGWWFLRSLSRQGSEVAWFLAFYLLVPLLLGWLVNLANPFTPRFFERTLLIAAPAWWVMIGAGLIWLWGRQPRLMGLVAGLLLLINSIGLIDFYRLPRYPEEDYRPLLAKVAAIGGPDDILLASYQWQLGYYQAYLLEPRPRLYTVPGWGASWGTDSDQMRADLSDILEHNVWFPAHQTLGRNWESNAEAIMAEIGFPTLLEWYNRNTKLSLVSRKTPIEARPQLNFQDKLQAEVGLPPMTSYESGRGIVPLEIKWTKLAHLEGDYLVTLKLVDAAGEIWATRNSQPHAAQASFADLRIGEVLTDRHGLLISGGTPPGSYDLRLSVTSQTDGTPLDLWTQTGQPQGVEASLTQITVVEPKSPLSPRGLALQTKTDLAFSNQVKLVGYNVRSWVVQSGDMLPVDLFWQSLTDDLPNLSMFVQLQDVKGRALALTERPPVYATTAWSTETLLRDLHKLRLPATIPPGIYKLAAGILLPDKTRLQTVQGDQVVLGEVIVEPRPHNFAAPKPQFIVRADFSGGATLIGYDLDRQENFQPGDALTLTLYWQGGAGFDRSWTVFAHIVDAEGHIWGQRDQLPGGGAFPTTGWVSGEYITDIRQIPLSKAISPGTYFVEVGLYDANSATFERISVGGGSELIFETPIQVSTKMQ